MLNRLFKKRHVKLVDHPAPFDFQGVDRISILGQPLAGVKTIPFSAPGTESDEPFDAKRHRSMDGRDADTVHRFVRPDGRRIEFLVREGVLIQVTEQRAMPE